MCAVEDVRLRRGMNYRIRGGRSIILTSQREEAPYGDEFLDNGCVLLYEGHDVPRSLVPNPKVVDQQLRTVSGSLNENGKFIAAAERYKNGGDAEVVAVWEKLAAGQWRSRGEYLLTDGYFEVRDGRQVVVLRLERKE